MIPTSRKESTLIALYKGKGDAPDCSKHRGSRQLEHGFKIFKKVLEGKPRKIPATFRKPVWLSSEKSSIGGFSL